MRSESPEGTHAFLFVIPAKAGIQGSSGCGMKSSTSVPERARQAFGTGFWLWIPAFAGMTRGKFGKMAGSPGALLNVDTA